MYSKMISLDKIEINKPAVIKCMKCCGSERRKLQDLGLICGTRIKAVQKSPSGNPTAYCFRGAVIALRDCDAKKIYVSYCI